MNLSTILLAAVLVSIVKPVLLFLTFLPWAWLISTKLDKDSQYFHLNRRMWNSVFLACGGLSILAALLIPVFWAGWPVALLVQWTPVMVYWKIRNASVPENERFYLTSEGLSSRLATRKAARAARTAMLQFVGPDGETHPVPLKEDPLFAVHVLAEDLIGPAMESRANHVEVKVGANGGMVSQTVDGIRYKREPLRGDVAMAVVDYLKKLAGLNVEDRRRRQTADFRVNGPNGRVVLSLATAGSSSGVDIRVDFDREKRLRIPFDGLGLLPSQTQALEALEARDQRHGLVLIGAPPGHGLSTSSYALLSRHDAYTTNIKTLEHEVLVQLDGVDHLQWDPTTPDIDYSTRLQSIIRRDPDIVLAGGLPDRATGGVVTDPGPDGPLIYISRRGHSLPGLIKDWVKLVGDLKTAVKPLRVVTNQRLVRMLCPNCRQPYPPSAEQLKKLNIPAGKVKHLYQASGKVQVKNKIESCTICGGTGYFGLTGIFELLVLDSEATRLLVTGDLKAVLAHARRNKMIYLQEAAISKVIAGETTIEEVVRVTAPPKSGGAPKPRPKPDPAPAARG